MKETLRKFRYEPECKKDSDDGEDIHIAGSEFNMHETLCGSADTFQRQIDTDEMPTCYGCLDIYNTIKNGKLRR